REERREERGDCLWQLALLRFTYRWRREGENGGPQGFQPTREQNGRRAPHGVLLTQPSPPAASLLPFVSPAPWTVGLSSVSDGGDAADGGTAGRVALTGVLALASLGGLVSSRLLLAQGSPFHKRPLPVLGEHG
ncbi:unnamed protein product, partial [Musa hybrid cultivar]